MTQVGQREREVWGHRSVRGRERYGDTGRSEGERCMGTQVSQKEREADSQPQFYRNPSDNTSPSTVLPHQVRGSRKMFQCISLGANFTTEENFEYYALK